MVTAAPTSSPRLASPRSSGPRQLTRRAEFALGAAGLASIIAIWQIASMTGALSPRAVPPPLDVAVGFGALLINTTFWGAVLATVTVALLGVVIVIAIAIPLAMAIHRSTFFRESTWFVLEFLKPIPPVALIPLTILIWGPTKAVELFLVVFAALWPMLTQLVYGLREVSGVALDMARVYRFTPMQRTFRIVIPSLTPFAMTGLRISITMALVTAIVTEYIIGIPGLGAMLSTAQVNGLLDRMYALIVAMGLLGLALNGVIAALNGPLLFWHASQRERVSS
ncbi:ABC transporter permease [Microbacterium thalassium]|uniref:ABC-type nitrate/sulfonate/bicarbonate transport system permease component n=1 Tax=Microbacterium thalassium TaxID=362649 RepID=A0A7X0KTA3_9MICO|nr:ABC transporter permease [Microbacterium thalassium]MBB6389838.1 ABC-type nitrate/sulfonate/bicarbonate transport system permease component [Microbacterium thalassium]GLK24526.1 nitrate ABC transporter permease [Microbacterium thalassium]